jgi:hypothetical protein
MSSKDLTLHFFMDKGRSWHVRDPWFRQLSYKVTVFEEGEPADVGGITADDKAWGIKVLPLHTSYSQLKDDRIECTDQPELTIHSIKVCELAHDCAMRHTVVLP